MSVARKIHTNQHSVGMLQHSYIDVLGLAKPNGRFLWACNIMSLEWKYLSEKEKKKEKKEKKKDSWMEEIIEFSNATSARVTITIRDCIYLGFGHLGFRAYPCLRSRLEFGIPALPF